MTIQQVPPTLDEIETLAHEAMATIPAALTRHIGPVVLRVEEFPDEETEAEMELESPFDILGLYRGVALPHKNSMATAVAPDMIFLYRRPILDYWCETGETLSHIVRHLMIHEIGHHFGFSDDDMDRLENEG